MLKRAKNLLELRLKILNRPAFRRDAEIDRRGAARFVAVRAWGKAQILHRPEMRPAAAFGLFFLVQSYLPIISTGHVCRVRNPNRL